MLLGFIRWLPGADSRFRGLSCGDLIEFQRVSGTKGEEWVLIDLLQKYILEKGGTRKSLICQYSTVKSFFRKNRASLPDDDFRIQGSKPKTKNHLSIEIIKTLIDNIDLEGKAIYLSLWMGLMDQERFCIFNRNATADFVAHLKEFGVEKPFSWEFDGRKKSRGDTPFYTFIGRDALQAWIDYFNHSRGWPTDGEPLIPGSTNHHTFKLALTQKHLRLLERLKYIKRGGTDPARRYGYGLHTFRDTARTLLHVEGLKDGLDLQVIEFFMGHVTDPNEYDEFYNKKQYVLEQYKIAEKYLNILTGSVTVRQLDRDQIAQLILQDPDILERVQSLVEDVKQIRGFASGKLQQRQAPLAQQTAQKKTV
jgi:hypothetical protein